MFIWPAVLVVLVVAIFPLVYSLTTSFLSYRLIPPTPPRFVGLDNYASLLQQARFWHVGRHDDADRRARPWRCST